jgi:hypothetical protein
MLSHCANSQCSKPFLRLGEGRLFLVEATPRLEMANSRCPFLRQPPRRLERYWLCDRCAEICTLVYDRQKGISLVPLPGRTYSRSAST